MYSGALSKMSASETDIGTCSLSNNRSFIARLRLLVSSNASISNPMACGKVSFFFFGYCGLSLKSCSKHSISSKPSSRIVLLLSNVLANCISRVSPLLPCVVFFERDHFLAPSWKILWTAVPMAAMELKRLVCFPTKTIHWISCNSSFPSLATHLMMDMHTPPLGLVFHPTDRFSRILPVAVERFFISTFGRLDSLSSTHHLRHSSRTNLCRPQQMACFGESCLTFGTCIMFRHFVELRDQQILLFVNADVHLRHPDLGKA